MRIISGFKDYYDYIANQNIDNKIVYQRYGEHYTQQPWPHFIRIDPHKADVANLFDGIDFATIHFCGTRHLFAHESGLFLYDLRAVHELVLNWQSAFDTRYHYEYGRIGLPYRRY